MFSREQVIHGAGELVRQHGERFGFAMFAFKFREILFSQLVLASEEHRSFGKGPT